MYMCLYPKLIKNPKYKPNKKNGFCAPPVTDERTLYVPIGCGTCIECCKKKMREWQSRLNEELREDNKCYFVTATFSEEELKKLCEEKGQQESNYIATIAVRRWLERYRKKNKKSFKHWIITELGQEKERTERIHLHGIVWGDIEEIKKHWKYGILDVGEYCNEKTINYIIKYITKVDKKHKGFKPIILNSKGIGISYIKKNKFIKNKYQPNGETNESYRLKNGAKTSLPIYWRNYIYSEEEKEKLWIEKLDKQERYILGQKIDISTEKGINLFEKIQKNAQKMNKNLGYGDNTNEWKKKKYNVTNHYINKLKRIKKYNEEKNKLYNTINKKNY